MNVSRALVSVSDKTGVVELARALAGLGVQILSTGGTARLLEKEGVRATEVSAHTGFPEMLDGRVKTLHPKIHGGILARRDSREHMAAIDKAGIAPIDLVVVNLYPFQATVADPDCTLENAVENIDIGGPTLLRAAAKNHAGVAVVVDPADYAAVLEEIRATGGVAGATRFALAKKVFAHTAGYDGAIANYLFSLDQERARRDYPEVLSLQFRKLQDMRYGENPHQSAAFYRDMQPVAGGIAGYQQIQGKELSYNNVADSDAAWQCVKTLAEPACVIVKQQYDESVGYPVAVQGGVERLADDALQVQIVQHGLHGLGGAAGGLVAVQAPVQRLDRALAPSNAAAHQGVGAHVAVSGDVLALRLQDRVRVGQPQAHGGEVQTTGASGELVAQEVASCHVF